MDKTIVFKCGGSVIRELSDTFYENVRSLQAAGFKLAIVHGGVLKSRACCKIRSENGICRWTAQNNKAGVRGSRNGPFRNGE